jgi:polyferredoxin
VKYLLLLLIVVLFALTWNYAVLAADPLITFFSGLRAPWTLAAGAGVVVLAFVFRRFWCRNLCPAGAFLALLCGVQPLKRIRPPTGPARCDLGVRNAAELDCLCCDRCRR